MDINRLQQDMRSRPDSTTVNNLAPWYGVLAAYTRYTSGLLKEDNEIPLPAMKKLTIIFEWLEAILYLFTEVVRYYTEIKMHLILCCYETTVNLQLHLSFQIGPHTCTTVVEVPTYTYNDPECTSRFKDNTLKFAANMITHLQTVVSDTREVQVNWYIASGIKDNLQLSLAPKQKTSWISRYTSNC